MGGTKGQLTLFYYLCIMVRSIKLGIRHIIWRMTALIIATMILISCGEEQNNSVIIVVPTPEAPPTYTLIYLASGGDTLDEAIERSISNICKSPLAENINLTANIKWTKGYTSAMSRGEGEVCRFVVSGGSRDIEMSEVGDNSYPLYEPENIAEFIRWSTEVAPADNYILVLAGHGNGWHPEVGIEATRGTLRDTDLDRYVSLEELSEAIELSGVRFKMIQMISCLMNTMEYVTDMANYADYFTASSHVSVMLCTELQWLHMSLRSIKSRDEAEYIEAMKEYMSYVRMDIRLLELENEKVDFCITNCGAIAALNEAIREFTDRLMMLYNEEARLGEDSFREIYGCSMSDVEAAISKAYYFMGAHLNDEEMLNTEYLRMAFSYDLVDITRRAAGAISSEELKQCAQRVLECARSARRIEYSTSLEGIGEVFYGVTLTNSEQWVARGYDIAGYEDTLFDRTTGWSRLLKRNNIELRY